MRRALLVVIFMSPVLGFGASSIIYYDKDGTVEESFVFEIKNVRVTSSHKSQILELNKCRKGVEKEYIKKIEKQQGFCPVTSSSMIVIRSTNTAKSEIVVKNCSLFPIKSYQIASMLSKCKLKK